MVALLIGEYHVAVPFQDSWLYVQHYKDWADGLYSWREFVEPVNMHPSIYGKPLYFLVLHFFHGQTTLLLMLNWTLSLGIALSIFGLTRSLWRERPFLGPVLMFLLNLNVFSLGQAGTWLWDFVYQNYTPGFCLATGLWLLSKSDRPLVRLTLAYALALTADFAFASGIMVGYLLTPSVFFLLREKETKARWTCLILWLVGVILASLPVLAPFLHGGLGGTDDSGIQDQILSRPWMTLQYILIVLGHGLTKGLPLDPEIADCLGGAFLLILFCIALYKVWRRRQEPGLLRNALPGLAFCTYAFGSSFMICLGRMRNSFITAMAPRYVITSLFF